MSRHEFWILMIDRGCEPCPLQLSPYTAEGAAAAIHWQCGVGNAPRNEFAVCLYDTATGLFRETGPWDPIRRMWTPNPVPRTWRILPTEPGFYTQAAWDTFHRRLNQP